MENIKEEVMKALEFKAQHDAKIVYIDGAACKHIRVSQVLDFIHSLQAEIERLTEENGQLKGYNSGLEYENAELQKQVDELTAENARLNKCVMSEEQVRKCCEDIIQDTMKKAKKQTAKEILQAVDEESNGQALSVTNALRKRYGVEVE